MVNWSKVNEVIAQLGFYLTTTFQFTLIILTLFVVQINFGSYKLLIILFSVLGVTFASIEYITNPILHSFDGGYIFFSVTHPLGASNTTVVNSLLLYSGLYASTISLIAVQFVYRYVSVFHAKHLKYFDGWYFPLWMCYVAWFGCQWVFGHYLFTRVDDFSKEYMREELERFYGVDIDEAPAIIMVVYPHPNSTDHIVRWWNLMTTWNMDFIMGVQYSIMIYCGSHLYSEMNERISNLSREQRKLHQQIFKALILQIAMPTMVLFSPLIFVIHAPLLDMKMSLPTGIFLSGFTLYPAIDAFILIYVISDYRKAIRQLTYGRR